MIEFVGIILFIIVLLSNRSLSSRVGALEMKMRSGIPATTPLPPPVVAQATVTGGMEEYLGQTNLAPVSATATQPKQPDPIERFWTWIKEDWLMKLGGLLFIIGCGWFVSYAFANNWVGPVGRISIGIIAGALVMMFAFWRMLSFPRQGGVFMATGAAMIILSILAGRSIYGFFTPELAVFFNFIIAAFVSFASYKFNLRSLAVTAQILAFSAPLLAAGETGSLFLFSYLLAVSVASLSLAAFMGWRSLIILGLVFVGIYSAPYLVTSHNDAPIILNFAYIFAMLYLLSGMIAVMKRGVQEMNNEIVLAVLNGIFLFLWIYNVSGEEWQTLLFATWAIVFAIGSFIAFRFSSKPDPFYAYGSVAIAFIAAATAAELNGAALTIALTIEICLLVIAVLALTKNTETAFSVGLLFLAPIASSFISMMRYLASEEVFTKDFFVLLILSFSLIATGWLIGTAEKQNLTRKDNKLWAMFIVFGTLYIWFIIWCLLHILMPHSQDTATFLALTVYTIVGIWMYFTGLRGNDIAREMYGAILLVFVVLRLLFVDVWSMELSGRVITFFVIGILLMSTAFLTKRKPASNLTV